MRRRGTNGRIITNRTPGRSDAARKRRGGRNAKAVRRKRNRILESQGGRCAECEIDLPGRVCALDHIVPLVDGGSWEDDNLRVICLHCDRRKAHQLNKIRNQKEKSNEPA